MIAISILTHMIYWQLYVKISSSCFLAVTISNEEEISFNTSIVEQIILIQLSVSLLK